MSSEYLASRIEQSLVPVHHWRTDHDAHYTLAERMAHYHVPAVSIAVVENGALQWARAYGIAAVDVPRPVSTASLFQAASISKPLTALAVPASRCAWHTRPGCQCQCLYQEMESSCRCIMATKRLAAPVSESHRGRDRRCIPWLPT